MSIVIIVYLIIFEGIAIGFSRFLSESGVSDFAEYLRQCCFAQKWPFYESKIALKLVIPPNEFKLISLTQKKTLIASYANDSCVR